MFKENLRLWKVLVCSTVMLLMYSTSSELLAQASRPIKTADVLFGKGEFLSAAKAYEKLANVSGPKKELYVQALAAAALSKINLGQQAKVFELLKNAELAAFDLKKVSTETQARLNIALGKYHLVYREHDLAIPLLQDSHKKSEQLGTKLSAPMHIELNKSLADLYYERSDYNKALEYYNQAIAAADAQPHEEKNYKQLADIKILAGEVYDKVLEPEEAIDRYERVLSQKDTLLKDEPERAGELYYRLGGVYFKRKDYDAAEVYLNQALKYELKEGAISDAKFMLSTIYYDREKYDLALILNGSALNSWSPQKSKLPAENFKAFLQFGKLSGKQTNSVQAKASYKKMTQKGEKWSIEAELAKIKEEKIIYAPDPKLSDNYNISLLSYHESSLTIPKLAVNKQTIAEIDVQMAKGALFFQTKNYNRAKGHFERALDLMKEIYPEKHPMVVEASRSLSEVYLEEQIYGQAMSFIDKALAASMNEGDVYNKNDVPAIDQAKFPLELLYAIGTKGKVLKGVYNENKDTKTLVQALAMFDATIKLLNKLRRTYRKEGSKYQLAALAQEFSQQASLVCYQLYEVTQKENYLHRAFDYTEIAKGSLLLEAVRDLKARKVANIPDSLIQKENEQKIEIAYLKGEIYYEVRQGKFKDLERLIMLEKELSDKTKVHEQLVLTLEQKYPKYFALKYDYSTVSIDSVQAALKENELLLDYLMLDSFVMIFTIEKEAMTCQLVPHQLKKTNRTIVKFLSSIRKNEIQDIQFEGTYLYRLLIQPLKDLLGNKDIIVIPDGFLNNIPFEVLPISENGEIRYLNEQHAFCYNYSATLYLTSKEAFQNTNAPKKIIGFAPDFAVLDSILNQGDSLSNVVVELDLEPLVYARQEVKVLQNLFGANSRGIIGAASTETAFKKVAGDYGVLHFATHGIVNHSDPMFSSLAFLTDDMNDGLLHTHELFSLELNAELVTLSACNSGVGKLYAGEGVMSIAKGFAYSGAPNMIMTLWPVSDQATEAIMHLFYQYLKEGIPKHKALQEAKLEFIKEYNIGRSHPQLWAGLIVIGNTEPVSSLTEIRNTIPWIWIVLGTLLVLIILFFLIKKRINATRTT
ncbi:CHAT domain-containing protein [Aureispira sp. CCB-QB1]|uniref:CHAT domain-containing protein n=1 Tax=Aureispira sp. CCB-QB1 TaxID=1313421 RepID=UPI000698D47B|nr:CHAT domain-containing protein [Aureispira sp. CCB-QB1]